MRRITVCVMITCLQVIYENICFSFPKTECMCCRFVEEIHCVCEYEDTHFGKTGSLRVLWIKLHWISHELPKKRIVIGTFFSDRETLCCRFVGRVKVLLPRGITKEPLTVAKNAQYAKTQRCIFSVNNTKNSDIINKQRKILLRNSDMLRKLLQRDRICWLNKETPDWRQMRVDVFYLTLPDHMHI